MALVFGVIRGKSVYGAYDEGSKHWKSQEMRERKGPGREGSGVSRNVVTRGKISAFALRLSKRTANENQLGTMANPI